MSEVSSIPLRRHWEILGISCAIVLCACLLRVSDDGNRVVLSGPWTIPLPPTCLAREAFGIPCPGCGLTRSFVHMAHGRWRQSWESHHVGWLLALTIVVQVPYRLWVIIHPERPILPHHVANAFGGLLIALLFVNWIVGWFVAT